MSLGAVVALKLASGELLVPWGGRIMTACAQTGLGALLCHLVGARCYIGDSLDTLD